MNNTSSPECAASEPPSPDPYELDPYYANSRERFTSGGPRISLRFFHDTETGDPLVHQFECRCVMPDPYYAGQAYVCQCWLAPGTDAHE